MTTTNMFSGISDEQKPSSRVLAPPGGGASNIFGVSNDPPKPRPTKHQSDSNIFGPPEQKPTKEVPPMKKDDSKNRLFGPPSPSASNSPKNRDESYNKLFGEPEPIPARKEQSKDSPQPVAAANDRANNKRAINPITGLPLTPDSKASNAASGDVPQRNSSRVLNPPGGRSSGPLW